MIHLKEGIVEEILSENETMQKVRVRCEGALRRALAYTRFTPKLNELDKVLLNTTAVDLDLGSGGYDYVVARLEGGSSSKIENALEAGHIMKLNYTPMQGRVRSVEEQGGPWAEAIDACDTLGGMPVAAGELHSMLAPLCALVADRLGGGANVVYVMTDAAGLFMGLSDTVRELKEKKLLGATITCGQAFGGDYEAVNVYSALLAARAALEADLVICTPGIGSIGTGTRFGFSGVQAGLALDAARRLGGRPVALVRMSSGDPRPRHRGISRHSLITLGRCCEPGADLPLPADVDGEAADAMREQAKPLAERHNARWKNGAAIFESLKKWGLSPTTMHRGPEEDPLFYMSLGAAAEFLAEVMKKGD